MGNFCRPVYYRVLQGEGSRLFGAFRVPWGSLVGCVVCGRGGVWGLGREDEAQGLTYSFPRLNEE